MRKVYVLKNENGTVMAVYGNKKALSSALVEIGFKDASYSRLSKLDLRNLEDLTFVRPYEGVYGSKISVALFYLYTH